MTAAQPASDASRLARLPKAELHVHLEGCMTPALLAELAEKYGEPLDRETIDERYHTRTFPEFLELFKWATSYLRSPEDYARLADATATRMIAENCRYAEVTLSIGVMLLRKQDVEANFAALLEAVERPAHCSRLRIQWIFDAVRQFGPEKAMDVARLAAQMKSSGVVAFGMGGDEESLPATDFRGVYDYAASEGLHRLVHAGEMGGPSAVRDAIEFLGAERIGHGIASIRDETLMALLIKRQIPLEICPQSNLCTGALAKLLGVARARIQDHPLPNFFARDVPVTLSTDDPAMFRTTLDKTYSLAATKMGLSSAQLVTIAEAGFRHAFLPAAEKLTLLTTFRTVAKSLGLL
jgi:adenosine deaminase